jgi:hypothetical protein
MNIDVIVNRYFNTDKGYTYLIDLIKNKYPNFVINEDNLKRLKVKTMSKEEFMRTSFSGIYKYSINTIEIFTNIDENGNKIFELDLTDEELINTFLHELIHALTSKKDKDNNINEGLNIRTQEGDNSIFLGINEGITQLITDDILGKESDAYPFETAFAKQLALIIGKDKLVALYSSNNYGLFVDTLTKIGSSVNIPEFIHKIFLFHHMCKGLIDDGGYGLGSSIQKDLIDLYKASGINQDLEFESLLLGRDKINKYMEFIPIKYDDIKYLGFYDIDNLINSFKERKI